MALLDRETIERALAKLDAGLAARGEKADLFLVGGAVMCLVHHARPSTKDVDGWFAPAQIVREVAAQVASELGLESGWLNDAAKGFVPGTAGFETFRDFDHLHVSVADARTLFAMKVLASRTEEDAADIRFLAGVLGVTSSHEALKIVLGYYPEGRLTLRSQLMLEELLDDRR